jgi:hypothetical protein
LANPKGLLDVQQRTYVVCRRDVEEHTEKLTRHFDLWDAMPGNLDGTTQREQVRVTNPVWAVIDHAITVYRTNPRLAQEHQRLP